MHDTFILANGLVAGVYFVESVFCATASLVLAAGALLLRRGLLYAGLRRRLWIPRVVVIPAAILSLLSFYPAARLHSEYIYHFQGSLWVLGPLIAGAVVLSVVSYVIVGREPKSDDPGAGGDQETPGHI